MCITGFQCPKSESVSLQAHDRTVASIRALLDPQSQKSDYPVRRLPTIFCIFQQIMSCPWMAASKQLTTGPTER
jgi:hypothetical protein